MKFPRGLARSPRRRGWRTVVVAAVALCSCSASYMLGMWSGNGTVLLTVEEAWDVIEDPKQPANRKQLATTQLFRLTRSGRIAASHLQTLAARTDAVGEQARNYLTKLAK